MPASPRGFSGRRDDGGELVVAGWVDRGLPSESAPEPGRTYADLRGA